MSAEIHMRCPKCHLIETSGQTYHLVSKTEVGLYYTCTGCHSRVPVTIKRGTTYFTNIYEVVSNRPVWMVTDDVMVAVMMGICRLEHGYI